MPWNRVTDIDQHWEELSWKFERILNGEVINQDDWFSCFSQVFQLLTSVDTDSLDRIHEKLYTFFKSYLNALAGRIKEEEDSRFLRTYRNSWKIYRENLGKLSKVFGTLLFEPYQSKSLLPSALYLPSLTSNIDDIHSDAEISSVYDIGVLYWQNVVVKPLSQRLIQILLDTMKESWENVICDNPESIDEGLNDVIIDVALTFSQRPGERFAAIRGINSGISESTSPIPHPGSYVNQASLFGPLLGSQNNKANESKQADGENSVIPSTMFVVAYQQLLKEYAVLSSSLDVSGYQKSEGPETKLNEEEREKYIGNLSNLSRFVYSEMARIDKIFGASLSSDIVSLMEELFFSGTRKTAIEKFLSDEATNRGLCQDVASLFTKVSVLPSGRRTATAVLAQYISGLSKMILDKRPADVAASPESFVSYFGGQLMNLRKTVESTFSDGMSESLLGAVVRAAEDVLASLSAEGYSPEDFTARYIDFALKRCSTTDPNNPEFLKRLDSFIGIFTYLTEKTLYQKYHAKLLFRRLVFGLSPSLEIERVVNRCMADICSSEYCVYLNRTIVEVERSVALSKDYAAAIATERAPSPSKLSALILSQHIWPLGPAPVTSLRLPNELSKHIDDFTSFYSKKRERARLTWLNGYATAELRLLYVGPRPITLIANIAYVVVLLCFSDVDSMPASTLSASTGLTMDELVRVTNVLSDQKLLIVSNQDSGEVVYSLNLSFASRHPRLRLLTLAPAGQSSTASSSTTATPKQINLNSTLGDTSMDLDQPRGREEPTIGRAAFIEKLVLGARDHVSPPIGFTCMDILRCVLAHPELTFTPTPNEVHLCLQRLAAIGTIIQTAQPTNVTNASHFITYKFS